MQKSNSKLNLQQKIENYSINHAKLIAKADMHLKEVQIGLQKINAILNKKAL